MKNPKHDCYDYVRRYYKVPAYIGVCVRVEGKEGVLVAAKSDLHYVHIRLDGEKHSHPYHPTYEIEYLLPVARDFDKRDEMECS